MSQDLTIYDVSVLVIYLFWLVNGFRQGFLKEGGGLISWILGIFAARHFANLLLGQVEQVIGDPIVSIALSFLIVVVVVRIVVSFVLNAVIRMLSSIGLGIADNVLGSILGAAKGFIALSLLIYLIGVFAQGYSFWRESLLLRWSFEKTDYLIKLLLDLYQN